MDSLASRERDLKQLFTELAQQSYSIPDSRRTFLSGKTIEGWYCAWKHGAIDALAPKLRSYRGLFQDA